MRASRIETLQPNDCGLRRAALKVDELKGHQ